MARTPDLGSVSTRLHRIAELARRAPEMVIVTLAHHIDLAWMYEAHRQTRKDGAAGSDEVTATENAEDLDEYLRSLPERFKSGSYFAPPVRRVQIPKGDGIKTRPIGIPTFEDKILQRAALLGHFSYHGLTGNGRALGAFRHQLVRIRHYWLPRWSQRRCLNCGRFARLLKRYPLPPPKVVHSIYRHAANPCA